MQCCPQGTTGKAFYAIYSVPPPPYTQKLCHIFKKSSKALKFYQKRRKNIFSGVSKSFVRQFRLANNPIIQGGLL
jgi:hypothetical protein